MPCNCEYCQSHRQDRKNRGKQQTNQEIIAKALEILKKRNK